jgi:hypothetical protein
MSTCFGHIRNPSSGGRMCICVANGAFFTSKLTVSGLGKYNKYHLPLVYILHRDDGLLIRPKFVDV